MVPTSDQDTENKSPSEHFGKKMNTVLAPGTKARRITSQPSDHTSKFIRSSNSSHGIQPGPFVQQFRLLIEIRCCHPNFSFFSAINAYQMKRRNERSVYMSWRQGIDTNSLSPQLASHTARHLEDSRLACVIRNPSMVLSNDSHLKTIFDSIISTNLPY